jgi:hypothetical protein
MSKQTEKDKMSTEAAKQALIQERQERSQACRQEIEAVLKKHKCGIIPMLTITPNGNQWGIEFPAQDA